VSMGNLASTYPARAGGRRPRAGGAGVGDQEAGDSREHPDSLTNISNLASTYTNQGRWNEAEGLLVSVVKTKKRVLARTIPTCSSVWTNSR